jgi:hypothetical protein
MRKPLLLLSAVALSLAAISAGANPNDANTAVTKPPRGSNAEMQRLFEAVLANPGAYAPNPEALGELCAIGALPGPGDSVNIRFGLFNTIGDTVNTLILDSFSALGGASLLHESVFAVTSPQGGATTVEYPGLVSGKGPVVASFTSFDLFDSTSFNTDPDTYDDPAFGATVAQLDGTVAEVVYNGDKRCRGTFMFNAAANASLAVIVQVHP